MGRREAWPPVAADTDTAVREKAAVKSDDVLLRPDWAKRRREGRRSGKVREDGRQIERGGEEKESQKERARKYCPPKSGAKNGTLLLPRRPPYPLVFANKTAKMTAFHFFDLFITEETLPGMATLLPSVGQ